MRSIAGRSSPAINCTKTEKEFEVILPELIDAVAHDTAQQKSTTDKVVRAALERIKATLSKGEEVNIVGFGRFEVQQRGERAGRNLRTGEALTIPPTKAVRFKVGKRLRDAVAGDTGKKSSAKAAKPRRKAG
jgi:DNA-binding protein HU-beta